MTAAAPADILTSAITGAIRQQVDTGRRGIVLSGLPLPDLSALLPAFGGPGEVYTSIVGGTIPDEVESWARLAGWDDLGLGVSARHAVEVRNRAPSSAVRLAIVLGQEERLHSLTRRGYAAVGPQEVIAHLCGLAGEGLAANDPQRHLWQVLGSPHLAPYLTLDGISTYFEAVMQALPEDPQGAPRRLLPHLGLLPDPSLLTARYASIPDTRARLLRNVHLVEQLQRADAEDRQKAAGTVQGAPPLERELLVPVYSAFLRVARGDLRALWDLTLPDAERLLGSARPSRKPVPPVDPDDPEPDPPDDPDPRPPSRPPFRSLSQAAIALLIEGEEEVLADLVARARERLDAGDTSDERLTAGKYAVIFDPDERVLALLRAAVGEDALGGHLHMPELPADVLLRDVGRHAERITPFDTRVDLRKLEEYLRLTQERLSQSFEGGELLRSYLERRKALLEHAPLLGVSPLAVLIAQPDVLDAARQSIAAYQRLLGHLADSFLPLRRKSQAGIERMYRQILSLDQIRVEGADEAFALLAPTHPLVLWKYAELVDVIRARGAELTPVDRALLENEFADLPEPLLAIYSPGPDGAEGAELGWAGRVGSLPVYRPVTLVPADLSEQSLRVAAEKLAALYPPAKEDLRILLVNPEGTQHVSRAFRSLREKKQFRRAHLVLARPRGAAGPLPSDNVLDELFGDRAITVEELSGSLELVAKDLQRRPVHLLAVAGTQRRNVVLIESAKTMLHPLSLPQQLQADPLLRTVTIRPKSIQPAEGGPQHPFGTYQTLIGDLSGNARSEFSVQHERPLAMDDVVPLLPNCQFLLVTGDAPGFTPGEGLLRLTQGIDLSGDAVFTSHEGRVLRGLEQLLVKMNFKPSRDGLRKLLGRLQHLGGEGLFRTVSDKAPTGFSATELRGQLGMAVALDWYADAAGDSPRVTLSLDSYLARKWLDRRSEGERSDLLSFREAEDGRPIVDVIEVKSYEATDDDDALESHAADQLQAIGGLMRAMLDRRGDLLVDRRRELLRLQVFREGLLSMEAPDPDWVKRLDALIDGDATNVEVRLTLVELAFERNIPFEQKVFTKEDPASAAEAMPITRVRLGETDIQRHLRGLIDRAEPREPTPTPVPQEVPLGGGQMNQDGTEGLVAPAPGQLDEPAAPVSGPAADRPAATAQTDPGDAFEPDAAERERIVQTAGDIYRVLRDLGIKVAGQVDPSVADIGPSVIRYKVRLQTGERVATLESRARDLMRELALENEPIIDNLPGTTYVGIDLPRPRPRPAPLRPVLDAFVRPSGYGLTFPIGLTPSGEIQSLDLTTLPHMLVAGTTGSGKTMFLYSLVVGLTRLYGPNEVQLLLVDPKETDFVFFRRLPHLRGGDVLTDPREAIDALKALLDEELEQRTVLLKDALARDIQGYNTLPRRAPIAPIVVVIDEFADLADVMGKQEREGFEQSLRRLAQRARNVGIHLVLATQRPTTDVVTGNLKANLPCRVSFRLASQVDSRTILDTGGAEHLLGRGDMLLVRDGRLRRLQGFLLNEADIFELLGIRR